MIITIDGPSASGKSSLSRELAKRLNIFYLNTGFLYRAVAYVLSQKYHDPIIQAGGLVPFSINEQDLLMISKISYEYHEGEAQLFFDEKNITEYLSSQAMDKLASVVSANRLVREALLILQRETAQKYSVVADGRDCGTVVFPQADYKFYLTASVDLRAQRRFFDVQKKGVVADFEKIKHDIEERDHRDMNRDVAPLKIPCNAVIIDNSTMTFEETIDAFLRIIKV